jgi:hypothetical protein
MTGLKMTVTYDDYTTEQADLNELQLGSSYQGELDELMTYVLLTGYGVQVRLPITVTAGGVTESGESSSFNPAVIYGPIIGVVVLAAIAVGVVFLLKKKKAAAGETVADATQPNADGKSEDEDKKEN